MQRIVIVDYGMANLRSVQKAFEHLGHPATIASDPNDLGQADKLVLPGVGAFRDAILRLRETELDRAIREHITRGKPFLGICLGLQLLFTTSQEDGCHAGLDLLPGEIVEFPSVPGLRVPHMGWNQLDIRRPAPALAGVRQNDYVYFVHSYYARPRDESIIATVTDYGGPFASAIWRDNIFATQFHPEKSQRVGLEILRAFAEMG